MIRLEPKVKSKGIKRTPLKRKPPKVRTAKPRILRSRELPKLPPKRKGLRIRIDPLDSLVSEYVRRRAVMRVGGCEKCLKPYR